MRILTRILAFIAFIIASAWLYSDQSFEPFLTTVVSFSALLASFYAENSNNQTKQSQLVGKGSTAIQAGGNVGISVRENERKDS